VATLYETVERARDHTALDPDECRAALVALADLLTCATEDLDEQAYGTARPARIVADENQQRLQEAMHTDPAQAAA
jgi:hypothetical protein